MVVESPAALTTQAHRLMIAGRFREALALAERAVTGARECTSAHGMVATLLHRIGRPADAERVVTVAIGLAQGTADAYDALAHVSMLLGNHERSNALYRRTVELAPGDPRFWYNFASSQRSFGRLDEAERACDRAIALDARSYASYLMRSEVKVQTPSRNHVDELRSILSNPKLDERARIPLGYALAKELDDLCQFDEAFRWFSQAASLRRRYLAYDVAVDEKKLRRIAEVFTRESIAQGGGGEESSRYVFIVGLPRSGTTLVEHILTGLPDVRSNGETDNFSRALMSVAPGRGEDVFERAALADPRQVAAQYGVLARGNAQAELIVEKLPMNYLYLGAIRRALPRAKILLVSRAPLDSCFAMYRTLFGSAYPFSYDFNDLARYYAAYRRLVDHWLRSFGESVHEVIYEDLVRNPEAVGAALAGYCGAKWDAAALRIDRNASISMTASAAQVRRPIYGSSSGRWKHYREHLRGLIAALRQQGVVLADD